MATAHELAEGVTFEIPSAMRERREYRRTVDNLRTWVGLNTPAATHGAAEEEDGERWDFQS